MEYLHMAEPPSLDRAILVGAFSGWNDAASAATWAVKYLVDRWEATQFAEIEPEEFYDFTETRPQVRISRGIPRRLTWPSNRFYARSGVTVEGGEQQRDVVLFLGQEPQLKWKTFTQQMLDVARQCNVEQIILLGALIAEVPHTVPVSISGTASSDAQLRRMERLGIGRASYEGPTGILGALHATAAQQNIASVSLWGTAPHYVSASPNLPVAAALLEKLDAVCGFGLHLQELKRAARRFTTRVSSLVAADPDVSAYVSELERRTVEGEGGESTSGTPLANDASGVHRIPRDGELPSPEQAIRDVEAWLRQFRGDSPSDA